MNPVTAPAPLLSPLYPFLPVFLDRVNPSELPSTDAAPPPFTELHRRLEPPRANRCRPLPPHRRLRRSRPRNRAGTLGIDPGHLFFLASDRRHTSGSIAAGLDLFFRHSESRKPRVSSSFSWTSSSFPPSSLLRSVAVARTRRRPSSFSSIPAT